VHVFSNVWKYFFESTLDIFKATATSDVQAFVLIIEKYIAVYRNKECILIGLYFIVGNFTHVKYSLKTSCVETIH
jgi:hypothetical protein